MKAKRIKRKKRPVVAAPTRASNASTPGAAAPVATATSPVHDTRKTKRPWHERALPNHWTEEEARFFTNWMRSLASLDGALTSTDRLKLLRRARNIYFKLANQLRDQIREAALRAGEEAGSSAEQNGFDWRGKGWVKAVLRRLRRQQFHGIVIVELQGGAVTGVHKKRSETISETTTEAAGDE